MSLHNALLANANMFAGLELLALAAWGAGGVLGLGVLVWIAAAARRILDAHPPETGLHAAPLLKLGLRVWLWSLVIPGTWALIAPSRYKDWLPALGLGVALATLGIGLARLSCLLSPERTEAHPAGLPKRG